MARSSHVAGTHTVTAFGSTFTLKDLTLPRSPPSSSYMTQIELDVDLPGARDTDERGLVGLADRGTGKRPGPVADSFGVHNADIELLVVRLRVGEDLDAAEQVADVTDQDAAGSTPVPRRSVDRDLRREGLRPQTLRSRPDVGGASEAVLEAPVGLLDHHRVEPRAGHHAEALAVEPSDVEPAPLTAQPYPDRPLDVPWDL